MNILILKNKTQILKQSTRDMLEDLYYISYEIDSLSCQSDSADYEREEEWYNLFYSVREEIIRRTREEEEYE